ncbi:hypothetical protein ABQJ54_03470 [Rhodanobacter sp. Si-c]|uniref:DUF2946 domain-containing protein n=1 Tax=Rhodanobacter lycopersici TaxID=3162487 RepID=A0ABV3QAE4_9GAMM
MSRLPLRQLRRCRLLFVLALCAWMGLAGSVFAHADCCAGMGGMTGAMTMTHHGGAPAPLHADGVHIDCACAHMTVALPELTASIVPVRLVVATWQAWPAAASKLPHAPPLRPPLA